MGSSARRKSATDRVVVGKVSVYLHHTAWWVYYRDGGTQVRKRVGPDRPAAEQLAAQINAQLAAAAPTLLGFTPITVADLRRAFLDYHEHVLKSSVGTLRRYRAATRHLEDFAARDARLPAADRGRPERAPERGPAEAGTR